MWQIVKAQGPCSEVVRIARTASTRISESEDASRRRCRPYDIGRISMHCCPLPLDNQGDKAPGAGENGTQNPGDSLAGDSRKVTPLACIHWPVKPLDGRMVVANPYLQVLARVIFSRCVSLFR